MGKIKKPTPAQRRLIERINQFADGDGFCSRSYAGYPNRPMQIRMQNAEFVEIIWGQSNYFPLGFKLTDAGKDAIK